MRCSCGAWFEDNGAPTGATWRVRAPHAKTEIEPAALTTAPTQAPLRNGSTARSCAGDERIWKFIVSPEFGEQIDLKRLTRELMGRIERELGGGSLDRSR